MSVAAEFLAIKTPNHFMMLKGLSSHSSLPMPHSSFLNFDSLLRPRCYRASIHPPCAFTPKGLAAGIDFPSLGRRKLWTRFAASHEESHSEIEVEKQKNNAADESQEAWKQTLESFKEQALKMQSVSQEAYEVYSKKAVIILKEAQEQLIVQADKTRNDLTLLAEDLTQEGREYLSTAAEKSPEPVKEIVETFASSTDDLNEISQVRDFYLGIPYGLLLSVGGFLSFMLTGSISAIRFGVILGGALLALSISSLKSFKRKEPNSRALKGQAAIAAIIFVREIGLLFQRASLFTFPTTIISGAMAGFYLYRIALDGKQSKGGSDMGQGAES
ncbi:protein FATTY ACID EXPORT 3, chloroplastic [Euphorbia lathyris]|uniref:protein FATTY ACID EXPORT 3, chloroplastic n=1 Tax=Euphorbia lathyris TaxID=212925 RepID=UPI003313319C